MAGKSGTNGGSQWNMFGGTTLDAKLVRKNAPNGMEMAQKWPILVKKSHFWP